MTVSPSVRTTATKRRPVGRDRGTATPDPRLRGWRAGIVWAIIALDLAFAFGVWLVAGPGPDTPPAAAVLFGAMVASLGGVGALVATRKHRNPVGWILWVSATMVAFAFAGSDYVRFSIASFGGALPGTVAIAWLSGLTFLPAAILVVVVVPLYFPDGTLLARRWRWAVAIAIAGLIVVALPSAFDPGPLVNTTIDNPLGVPGLHALDWLLTLSNVMISLVAFPLTIASCVLRYRRGTPTIRQQLKWFAAAVGWTVACFTLAIVGIGPLSDAGWFLGLVGLTLLPIAIGIAILRYRLYEIDRIISRTITYAVVSVLLGATFAATILVSQTLLAPFTQGETIAVAASTLAAFALFQPLLRRVRRAVDRRFDRSRYDAERTAAAFSERLRNEVDMTTVTADLVTTTGGALAPASIGIWLRGREAGR